MGDDRDYGGAKGGAPIKPLSRSEKQGRQPQGDLRKEKNDPQADDLPPREIPLFKLDSMSREGLIRS